MEMILNACKHKGPFKSLLPLLLMAAVSGIRGAPDVIYIHPFVNDVDTSSARVIWISDNNKNKAKVILTQNGNVLTEVSAGVKQIKKKYFHYSVRLTQLKPASKYHYRVTHGPLTMEGHFSTSPARDKPVIFSVYGDVRGHPERHLLVAKSIAEYDPGFVLCVGDLTGRGKKWKLWKKEFFDPALPYLSKSVLWPVRGNHEDQAENYLKLFDLPGQELYYSFDAGDVHIVVLDSEGRKKEKIQMEKWLRSDLKKNTLKWVIVLYHRPTLNVSGHESKWGRKKLLPILESGGVDVVITGHSHLYERFVPIGPPGKKPLIHIVTGGGGAPFHKPDKKINPALATGKSIAELHHIDFRVHRDTLAFFTRVPGRGLIDSLTLVKSGNAYQPEVMKEAITTQKAFELLD